MTTKKMLQPEFMRIPLSSIPQTIIEQYKLMEMQSNGFVYVQIDGGMYGLPQATRLANDKLIPRLKAAGYYQAKHTPGLFRHKTKPVMFCLIVDDFGVQYTGKEHAEHLLSTALDYKYQHQPAAHPVCSLSLDR